MPTPTDFLAAFTAYLGAEPTLTATFGDRIYTEDLPPDPAFPYVSLQDYVESLPGESLDDEPITFTLAVYDSSLDGARAAARVLKTAVDSRAINPASTRDALSWDGGNEVCVRRNPSRARRQRQPRGETPVFAERIDYEIWVTPNQ